MDDMYCYIHGLPTSKTGSWMSAVGAATCGNPACAEINDGLLEDLVHRQGKDYSEVLERECAICSGERARRARVMKEDDERHRDAAFVSAPYVHPNNAPKYHALQRRAQLFAQQHRRQLLWVQARDQPMQEEDKKLSGDALRRLRD